jgi:hypothetical protein
MNKCEDFSNALRKAIAARNDKEFESLAYQLGTIVLEEGSLPDPCFEELLAALGSEEFLKTDNAWKLVRTFEENWSELSEPQKAQLLPVLVRNYDRFANWMACFVIASLLGESYADERGFASLCTLQASKNEKARAVVAHGLEHIALEAESLDLRRSAMERLRHMSTDRSQVVRTEAEEAISRTTRKTHR